MYTKTFKDHVHRRCNEDKKKSCVYNTVGF